MATECERSYADVDAYKLPNDAPEQTRLEKQHVYLSQCLGNRVSLAPLKNPSYILDIGCGTGACTRNFAAANPTAQVYGIDLTPVPHASRVITPDNAAYITGNVMAVDDLDERLQENKFDHIFSRLLVYGIQDWSKYVQCAAALAAPGGLVEMQDVTIHLGFEGRDEPYTPEWLRAVRLVAHERGFDLDCGSNIQKYMRGAGLVDVEVTEFRLPFGDWMKETHPETENWGCWIGDVLGSMKREIVRLFLGGDSRWSEEQVQRFQDEAYESMQAEQGKYLPFIVTVGRKPFP